MAFWHDNAYPSEELISRFRDFLLAQLLLHYFLDVFYDGWFFIYAYNLEGELYYL